MSSKLSGGLADASREALESLVAMGDTSVPGVEASDINDGDIMANTRERVNNQGQFQFVYIPPDGSDPIESDWIQQDHKKKVILGWCEGVKGAIISRGQAGMAAANEAAMEAKLKKLREDQFGDEVITDEGLDASVPTNLREVVRQTASPRVARPAQSADAQGFVDEQLDIARERLAAAQQAQQEIIREVIAARKDYEKWQALSGALSGIGGDSELRDTEDSESPILRATERVQRS